MILILSRNDDYTTNEVVKWLLLLKKDFIRINEDEFFDIKIFDKKIYLESRHNGFFIDDITSVWYRRGGLKFKKYFYKNAGISLHMDEVQFWLEDYILKKIQKNKSINKQTNSHVNKLEILDQAKSLGFDVPNYFLETSTKNIKIKETILKTITENVVIDAIFNEQSGIVYTSVLEKDEEDVFFYPTLFQEKLDKDFEIRCFFLNDKIWSFATFSQSDSQTKIDLRRYNHDKPNRNVPYILPVEIEKKIIMLMQSLDLNSGSLDFIKSKDKFYFLEVNPIGQFSGLSSICNFCLEKEIALVL